jgi:hypothetical protein
MYRFKGTEVAYKRSRKMRSIFGLERSLIKEPS